MAENNQTNQIRHISDLTTDPQNARSHPARNLQMISDSLQEVGAGRSILIDENGRILAGNGVVEAGGQVGFEDVIVVPSDGKHIIAVQRTDLTEQQKTRIALFDNRTAELAQWDVPTLQAMEGDGFLTGLFTPDELENLWTSAYEEPEAQPAGAGGDDFDETPQEDDTLVQIGDLWQLGPHQLYCGDARVERSYWQLLGDTHPDLLFTDPPYGVSYDRARGDYKGVIQNDDLRGDGLYDFLMQGFRNINQALRPGAALYVFHADGPYGTRLQFERAFTDTGWHLSATLIWVKNLAGYGYADYRAKHEPILYGWTDGAEHYFSDDHTQTTEWRIDRDPNQEYLHPNQKPIAIVERALRNSTRAGNVVLDTYAGGGPTLIGAHRTERIARLMDSDPHWCSVIVRRAIAEGIDPIQRVSSPEA